MNFELIKTIKEEKNKEGRRITSYNIIITITIITIITIEMEKKKKNFI
jgi:hypothetical protein